MEENFLKEERTLLIHVVNLKHESGDFPCGVVKRLKSVRVVLPGGRWVSSWRYNTVPVSGGHNLRPLARSVPRQFMEVTIRLSRSVASRVGARLGCYESEGVSRRTECQCHCIQSRSVLQGGH
jgi:hypothetical protein